MLTSCDQYREREAKLLNPFTTSSFMCTAPAVWVLLQGSVPFSVCRSTGTKESAWPRQTSPATLNSWLCILILLDAVLWIRVCSTDGRRVSFHKPIHLGGKHVQLSAFVCDCICIGVSGLSFSLCEKPHWFEYQTSLRITPGNDLLR